MLQDDCISMAGSDVAYNNLSDSQKNKAEYQFLKNALQKAPHGIHQGVYIITPSGKYITRINWGWPVPDRALMNTQLKKAIADYQAMSKSERRGNTSLREIDRSMPKEKFITPPPSWLTLSNTARVYPFAEMEPFDIRHPNFTKIDKLWLSRDEKLQLVPSNFSIGNTEEIQLPVIRKLLNHSHLIASCAAWWDEHTKKSDFTMTVKAIKNGKVTIHYKGSFTQIGDSKWNQSSYKGDLLGKAEWNLKTKKFDSIQWVALGTHSLTKLKSNMHRGNTKTVTIAAKLEFDTTAKQKANRDIPPARWDEYPRSQRASIQK